MTSWQIVGVKQGGGVKRQVGTQAMFGKMPAAWVKLEEAFLVAYVATSRSTNINPPASGASKRSFYVDGQVNVGSPVWPSGC